jgi:glycerophosphoryl diester phosphodiesterase
MLATIAATVLIIGHRGSPGLRPEHTLASYQLAIDHGADFIEPDVVMTKDHVLIARHENEISGTTDVATKFPDRKKKRTVDGSEIEGWFAEDFTLKEIKTLRAKERLATRDQSYNGKFEIPTLSEVLDLAKKSKRKVGVYVETKHPSYHKSVGLPLEEAVVKELKASGFDGAEKQSFIQSFELGNLQELKKLTSTKLIYLLDEPQVKPADFVISKDPRTYGDMTKPENLKELAKTVYGIGPYKRMIIPENKEGVLQPATSLVQDAHKAGLKVHTYTFRSDKEFLNKAYGGNPSLEYEQFFKEGVDGVFSDFTQDAVKARSAYKK